MSAGPGRERDGFGFRGDAMLFLKSVPRRDIFGSRSSVEVPDRRPITVSLRLVAIRRRVTVCFRVWPGARGAHSDRRDDAVHQAASAGGAPRDHRRGGGVPAPDP